MPDVKTNLLKTALRTLHLTRLDQVLSPVTQGTGVIFMLHHVLPAELASFAPNRILSITPEFFNQIIEHVKASDFDIVSMDEAHARMAAGGIGDRRFVTFTFDDGYRDNIDYALPIARRHGVPVTIYACPDFADGQGLAWWLTLEHVLEKAAEIRVPFADAPVTFPLETVDEKYTAHRAIYAWLRTMPDEAIHTHVNRWADSAGIDPRAATRTLAMNWDELREAASDPLVTIGAHSMSHASLAKCSLEEARWQIAASVDHIEHQLGRHCRHFAYPYGDAQSAGQREFELARSLGLATAVTTRKGLIGSDVRQELTALPRLSLNGDFQDEQLVKVLLTGAPFKMLDLARAAMPSSASA